MENPITNAVEIRIGSREVYVTAIDAKGGRRDVGRTRKVTGADIQIPLTEFAGPRVDGTRYTRDMPAKVAAEKLEAGEELSLDGETRVTVLEAGNLARLRREEQDQADGDQADGSADVEPKE